MKNIICIDLTLFNNEQLKKVADSYNLSYKHLLEFKEKTYAKVWISAEEGKCVAFTLVKDNAFGRDDYDSVRPFNNFLRFLDSMESCHLPVEDDISTDSISTDFVILDTDIILEKIFKYGKDSLTKEERDYLDSLNK